VVAPVTFPEVPVEQIHCSDGEGAVSVVVMDQSVSASSQVV
jgi:hypothetical protein